MASPPKKCKYGCGTVIEWDAAQHQFNAQGTKSKHDCRDWDKSTFPPATDEQTSGRGSYQASAGGAAQQSTLEEVRFKKTWENYFKHLEAINPNLVSIHSMLTENAKTLKSIEEHLAVVSIKSASPEKVDEKEDEGA